VPLVVTASGPVAVRFGPCALQVPDLFGQRGQFRSGDPGEGGVVEAVGDPRSNGQVCAA
jgi:hypothetical protein